MEEPPVPLAEQQPGRSCAESKDEETGGEGILLALHHHSPTTSIFATRVASSTRHCYSYSIQHLRVTGEERQQWDRARQKAMSLLIVPPCSLKSGECHCRPSSPPSKGRPALGHDAPLQGHLSPPVIQNYFCTLFIVSSHGPDALL